MVSSGIIVLAALLCPYDPGNVIGCSTRFYGPGKRNNGNAIGCPTRFYGPGKRITVTQLGA